MIKLIIFDMDGVICDSRQTHHSSLNFALKNNGFAEIAAKDFPKFEGLPTKSKLNILLAEGKVSEEKLAFIEADKQRKTIELYRKMKRDDKIFSMLNTVKNMGYKIALATNSVPETTEIILQQMEIRKFFDEVFTNASVTKPKPSPEIYLTAMKHFRVSPKETTVYEDSPRGLAAANAAGIGAVIKVLSPSDLSANFVLTHLRNNSNL